VLPPRRRWVAFGRQPAATPAQQLESGSEHPQPGPIGESITLRVYHRRAGRAVRGPLAAGPGSDSDDSGDEGDDEETVMGDGDGDDSGLLSLEELIVGLEGIGVTINRTSLPSPTVLGQQIRLPRGGKVGSVQRARLKTGLREVVRGICAAVNIDGEGTAHMVGELLTPAAPLEERQRLAADRSSVDSIVASYKAAVARGLSKREQRQRLSPLVSPAGQAGYTRAMLEKEHGLKLTKWVACPLLRGRGRVG
jgi:hypothetical protein